MAVRYVAVIGMIGTLALGATQVWANSGGTETSGVGEPGDAKKPARVVLVTMRETDDGKMVYNPPKVDVRSGEQIRFKITNQGKNEHEFVLNTFEENQEHKAEMAKNPGMEHDDPNNKTVAAGKTAEVLWKFTKPGTYEYACLIPGHYEAGMHAAVVVK